MHRPTCYDCGIFIDGPLSSWFITTNKFQPLPRDYFCPKYFIWLPHLLCQGLRIPCPDCLTASRCTAKRGTQYLCAKRWPKSPHRIVDFEECIYIIGYRYVCLHAECQKTYLSWSPKVLSALPRSLFVHFTHHLTHRNGLTDRVVSLMRSCFQHGIGPGPFAKMIRTQHVRYHEQLHIQYLETVFILSQSAVRHFLTKFLPFGLFDDINGYGGFVPSPGYFRFYIRFIASHAAEMDQHMAMHSAEILQIDHSFKVFVFSYFFVCKSLTIMLL